MLLDSLSDAVESECLSVLIACTVKVAHEQDFFAGTKDTLHVNHLIARLVTSVTPQLNVHPDASRDGFFEQ